MLFRKRGPVRIDDSEQEMTDFDWFAADEQRYLAHFATAGFKHLPASVTRCAEDLAAVTEYFQNRAPVFSGHRVNPDIGRDRSDWKGEAEEARYLSSFVKMAARGLYSYDIETYVSPMTAYFCVAIPIRPLSLDDLPQEVREIIGRTVLKGVRLEATPRIEYGSTLHY
jgi:hypothetical protein